MARDAAHRMQQPRVGTWMVEMPSMQTDAVRSKTGIGASAHMLRQGDCVSSRLLWHEGGTSWHIALSKALKSPATMPKRPNNGITSLMRMGIITKEKAVDAGPRRMQREPNAVSGRLPPAWPRFFWHPLGVPRRAVPWKGAARRCVLERIDS